MLGSVIRTTVALDDSGGRSLDRRMATLVVCFGPTRSLRTRARIVITTDSPGARSPILSVTVRPFVVTVPLVADASTTVLKNVPSSVSDTTTPVSAVWFPFVTVIVNVTISPGMTLYGWATLMIPGSLGLLEVDGGGGVGVKTAVGVSWKRGVDTGVVVPAGRCGRRGWCLRLNNCRRKAEVVIGQAVIEVHEVHVERPDRGQRTADRQSSLIEHGEIQPLASHFKGILAVGVRYPGLDARISTIERTVPVVPVERDSHSCQPHIRAVECAIAV